MTDKCIYLLFFTDLLFKQTITNIWLLANKLIILRPKQVRYYAIKEGTRVKISDSPAAVSCIIGANTHH